MILATKKDHPDSPDDCPPVKMCPSCGWNGETDEIYCTKLIKIRIMGENKWVECGEQLLREDGF